FWADIDTEGRDSLYIKLFQNKAVLKPIDPTFQLKYVAPLASLPSITFSDSQADSISYDQGGKKLRIFGRLNADEQDLLLSLSIDPAYQEAITKLYQLYQAQSGEVAVDLASLPVLTVPTSSDARFSYDAAAHQLGFIGAMSEDERTLLLSLSADANYRLAIDDL